MGALDADGLQCHVVTVVENTSKGENVRITTEMVAGPTLSHWTCSLFEIIDSIHEF